MSRTLSSSLLRTEVGLVRMLALVGVASGLALLRSGLSRVVVALVFAFAMPPASSNSRVEDINEISAQVAEEHESHRRHGLNADVSRRPRLGTGPSARDLELPSAPRSLAPRRGEAPRQRWQYPRRSIPPDGDDEALARA
jgi:hypothetical protein